jgi:predicted protein tyrosine phosphatase
LTALGPARSSWAETGWTRAATNSDWKSEKSWKFLYFRSFKLRRAQKLGKVWPRREWLKLLEDAVPVNVLFVCSRNQWRGPTGEKVWGKVSGVAVRSAGTSRKARRRLTLADIRWADLILVMEQKHKLRIMADFRDETKFKSLHVLDIPDDYQFMASELVEIITEKAEPLIYQTSFRGESYRT